jgi:flagellar assembly protein FliH
MSLSDQPKDATFQRVHWAAAVSAKTPNQSAGAGAAGAQFAHMAPVVKKAAEASSFESPYISEHKLREILEADRRQKRPAEPDAEEVKRLAYAEGFAKGEADGFNAGKQQTKPILDQLQRVLSDVNGLWQLMVTRYERQLMDLVCRVAEKIVLGHVEIEPETVKRAILDAFSVVPEPINATIEVNPKDYEYIETIKEDFFDCIASLKDVAVLSDPSVARGGCKIRTTSGEVDATIQSRLESVRKCFIEANGSKNMD